MLETIMQRRAPAEDAGVRGPSCVSQLLGVPLVSLGLWLHHPNLCLCCQMAYVSVYIFSFFLKKVLLIYFF